MFYNLQKRLPSLVRCSLNTSIRTISAMRNPVVSVKQGKLRGSVDHLLDGSLFYRFQGVPYAQPPLGPLRFKAPLPVEPWSGVYDALEHGPVSPQVEMLTMEVFEGNENCLFLNIYSKSLQPDSKLPVMVYIHGGAYMSGSGDSFLYGPKFLLQHDVILVTINYRLEMLGFLCLGTPEAPGNAGMKDQVAALRWVQNNIAKFGGDPGNVTIFGESAGGSSINFHMFSPMSKGLFHKAIAQSGVCISDWANGMNSEERAFRAGKLLGMDTDDPQKLLDYFRSLPATKLVGLTSKTLTDDEKYRGLPIHFVPVVEKKFGDTEVFLEEDPLEMLLEEKVYKVPMMVGYNSAEGLLPIQIIMNILEFYNKNPSYFVPREVALKVSEVKLKDFGERIKKFYSKDGEFTTKDVNELSDLMTDVHFMYNAQRFSHLYSMLCQSVYMYRFNCVSELNYFKQLLGKASYRGACHFDDIFYMFSNNMNNALCKEHERLRKMVYNVTKLWTNFAKTGNPTPDNSLGVTWSAVTPAGKEYLSIEERLSSQTNADRNRVNFWNKLYAEAGCPHSAKSYL